MTENERSVTRRGVHTSIGVLHVWCDFRIDEIDGEGHAVVVQVVL